VPKNFPGGLEPGTEGSPPAQAPPPAIRAGLPTARPVPGQRDLPRVPLPAGGIQSNHCRDVSCANFGVEPHTGLGPDGRRLAGPFKDGYGIAAHRKVPGWKRLKCRQCGQLSSLKSNEGIREELDRISAYLRLPPEPSCQTPGCLYRGRGIETHAGLYQYRGRTKSGSERWRCKGCHRSFAVSSPIRRQRRSNENREVFLALVNKAPIRGIARARDLSPKAVYDKIDFIHRQCLAFVADRERDMRRARLARLYLATDRQDYVINWTDRKDKRNTQLTAVGTSDNRTGYVFGMHLNFDQAVDREATEALAIVAGDFDGRDPSFRKYARLWMEPDLELAIHHDPGDNVPGAGSLGILGKVEAGYDEIDAIPDPEDKERVHKDLKLPVSGMQVHFAYTVHAHFRLLRRLLAGAGKIRFFFDQDDTIRAACLSAFKDEMRTGRADAFYVTIDKLLTVDDRRRLVKQSKDRFEAYRKAKGDPGLKDWRIRVLLMEEALGQMPTKKGGRREPWVEFPEHTMGEPKKAVGYLTDRSDYGIRRSATLHARASLHSIDRFFMQIRRLVSLMERPIATPSNRGRVWRGYTPYRPERIQQILDIYRVYYDYVALGKDKKTPAMRLGLAKGRVRIEDILYFGSRPQQSLPDPLRSRPAASPTAPAVPTPAALPPSA
jgi:hypothetical protein